MQTCCFLWAATWFAVSPAQGASPADAVPDSASAVIRWKSPQASAGKAADFVDAVQPGFGTFVRAYLPSAGQLIGIPGLQGVDLDQEVFTVVFAEPQVSPTVVFIITAKDVKAVKKALSSDYEVHTDGNLVAYSDDKESLDEIRERLSGKGKSLWSKIDAASLKTFNDADLSLIINVKQLALDYADELKNAEPQIDVLIDRIVQQLPDDQRQQMASVFDIYRQIGKSALSAVQDTNSFALGLTIARDAIRYEDRLQVEEGSPTAKFLAGQPSTDLSLINKLPADKTVYFGAKFDMTSMTEWSMKMTKGMIPEMSAEQSAQFDAAVKEMSSLKHGEMAFYFDLQDEAPALRSGTVMNVTPTDRLREISRTLSKMMNNIEFPNFKQTMTFETNVAKIGGAEVDRITLKQEFDGALDPLGVQKMLRTTLFGNDGMQTHFVYQSDRVLQTMGGGTDELQSLATSLETTKKPNSAIAEARQQSGDKANLVGLLDLTKLLVNSLKLAGQATPLPFDTSRLDDVKLDASFLGYTFTCEPTSVRSKLELPLIQFQNIAKIVSVLQPQR